jgi:hypothetical protein
MAQVARGRLKLTPNTKFELRFVFIQGLKGATTSAFFSRCRQPSQSTSESVSAGLKIDHIGPPSLLSQGGEKAPDDFFVDVATGLFAMQDLEKLEASCDLLTPRLEPGHVVVLDNLGA